MTKRDEARTADDKSPPYTCAQCRKEMSAAKVTVHSELPHSPAYFCSSPV
jgi:hypothetical protein